MPPVVLWFAAVVILLGPPLSVIGMVVWARRLGTGGAPRVIVVAAYVLAATVGLVTLAGYVGAVIAATHSVEDQTIQPSQKARALGGDLGGDELQRAGSSFGSCGGRLDRVLELAAT